MDKKYGMLRILKEVEPGVKPCGQTYSRVLCQCDCGNQKIIRKYSVTSGRTKSCGCLQRTDASKRMTKHGMCGTKLNNIYRAMKRRCYNKSCPDYRDYGARGIFVCKEWLENPENFYKWAEDKYSDGMSIERININKGYSPDNCTFIESKKQARNKRNTFWVGYKGKKISLAEACENESLNYHASWQKIKRQHESISSVLGESYYEIN